MFRSLWCRLGKRSTAIIINGDSSSSSLAPPSAKYFLFTAFQNQNVVISNSRVTSTLSSFSTSATASDGDSSFVVSYLINSCGLSRNQAITASKKLNFKTTFQPDSVLTLLKSYGFTQPHISVIITKYPPILLSNPSETLEPKLDFFNSKGIYGIDLAKFISSDPRILKHSLNKGIIPSFGILKSIVQSDENVIQIIKRNYVVLSINQVQTLMVNLELLRNEGVSEANISRYLIQQPRTFMVDSNRFKGIVQKVKDMGFNHLQTTFLKAIHALATMSEPLWRKKKDVYKRWGWSEEQIQAAFRKNPGCMMASEEKVMAIMNFLVNEMGYDSLSVAENPIVFNVSLKKRIIPRCSVIKTLVSKSLIKEMISINSLSKLVDGSFLEKFVTKYEKEVPELMKIFQGHLNYQELLQN